MKCIQVSNGYVKIGDSVSFIYEGTEYTGSVIAIKRSCSFDYNELYIENINSFTGGELDGLKYVSHPADECKLLN